MDVFASMPCGKKSPDPSIRRSSALIVPSAVALLSLSSDIREYLVFALREYFWDQKFLGNHMIQLVYSFDS